MWLAAHHKKTVFCLLQFKDAEIDELPRVYFATPEEIAEVLHKSAGGRGETVLREHHEWGPRAVGKGTIDKVPEEWKFSRERLKELFDKYGI